MSSHKSATHRHTLPLRWTLWFCAAGVLALYVFYLALHWANQLGQMPPGLSALTQTVVVVLFVAGCLAALLERLDDLGKPDPPRLPRADTGEVVRRAVARGYVDGVRERHQRRAGRR